MTSKNTLSRYLFLYFILIIMVLSLSIGIVWLIQIYMNFNDDTKKITKEYTEAQKQIIKKQVIDTIDYIDYMRSKTETRAKDILKSRVYEAINIANVIYTSNKDKMTKDEIFNIIKNTLRPIRFNNGRGYYFATSLDGVEVLFADKPDLEGKNLINTQDTKGNYVIKDMIQIINRDKEGFYSYTWTKPDSPGVDYRKLSFIKIFEPLNFFIGTGEYIDDMENEIKGEVIERISKIRYGADDYIYLLNSEGYFIYHPDSELNKKMRMDLTDQTGNKITVGLIKVAKDGGGYLNYYFKKPSKNSIIRKISYAKAYQPWDWIIGTGVYLDDLDESIRIKSGLMKEQVQRNVLKIIMFILAATFISLFISTRISKMIKHELTVFQQFFKNASTKDTKIDISNLKYEELDFLALAANKMIDERKAALEALIQNEKNMRSIFRAAPVGIGLTIENNIIDANDRLYEMLGYGKDELLGKNIILLYSTEEEYRVCHESEKNQIINSGTGTIETRWMRKDGRMIDVLLSFCPIDPVDWLKGITITALDITARKKAENELFESKKHLQSKLDYILSIKDEIQDISLSDLVNLDDLQRIQDSFAEAAGVSSIITDTDGTPITKGSNFCGVCTLIRSSEQGKKQCLLSDKILGEEARRTMKPLFRECLSCGFLDASAPIIVGGHHVANWLIGQVRPKDYDAAKLIEYAKKISVNEDEIIYELNKVDGVPPERFQKIINLLWVLAREISLLGYNNLILARDVTQIKEKEESLKDSEEKYRALTEHSEDIIMRFDRQHRHLYVNKAVEKGIGIKPVDMIGKTHNELGFPQYLCELWQMEIEKVFDTGKVNQVQFEIEVSGTQRVFDWRLFPEFDEDGKVKTVITSARDISEFRNSQEERFRLESQLNQLRRLEAVGKLAGGIAHDFNNILQVISGYLDILFEQSDRTNPLFTDIDEIRNATNKAIKLVRQLLTFSRQEEIKPRNISVEELISGMAALLSRVIGENIVLDTEVAPQIFNIYADSGQIEQVLMNLCINSRDAMPKGGRISLKASNISIDSENIEKYPLIKEGDYVVIQVIDDGEGIPPDIVEHIFEPFFTTKEDGKGTGLGLATVYGIVKQHQGFISVESELGKGTTFNIYLPASRQKSTERDSGKLNIETAGGSETILIAEDDEMVRNLVLKILQKAGYKIICASDGNEAINKFSENKDLIDLALLDVIMPGMSGKEVADNIKFVRRDIPVVFCSGYDFNILKANLSSEDEINLIHKPYIAKDLLQKIRETLDRKKAS